MQWHLTFFNVPFPFFGVFFFYMQSQLFFSYWLIEPHTLAHSFIAVVEMWECKTWINEMNPCSEFWIFFLCLSRIIEKLWNQLLQLPNFHKMIHWTLKNMFSSIYIAGICSEGVNDVFFPSYFLPPSLPPPLQNSFSFITVLYVISK